MRAPAQFGGYHITFERDPERGGSGHLRCPLDGNRWLHRSRPMGMGGLVAEAPGGLAMCLVYVGATIAVSLVAALVCAEVICRRP